MYSVKRGYSINITKKTCILVVAIIIHLGLLAYLATINFEHTIRIPTSELTIFGSIAFTNYEAYFVIAFSLGILVVPYFIEKTGFLNNYPDEPPDADLTGGYTDEEAERDIDRLVGYTRNHTLSMGVSISAVGTFMFLTLSAYLRDEAAYSTGWQKAIAKSFEHLSLPFLFVALAVLVIGVALIGQYINKKRASN